jgi:protein SCO1/2
MSVTNRFHQYRYLFLGILFICAIGVKNSHAVDLSRGIGIPLIDENGQETSIAHHDGSYRLVFFGYTYCPDICPLTLLQVGRALRSIKGLDHDLKTLFISIDPVRDRPATLKDYTDAFHPSIIGMSGKYDDLVELSTQFRTTFGFNMESEGEEIALDKEQYLKLSSEDRYTPFHSSQIYLLDQNGELLDIIGYGSQSDQIASIITEHINQTAQ